ncbi:MAG: DUF2975 domain-containing protein [Bacteroidales bacterium]
MKKKLNLICFLLFCSLGLTLALNILSGVEGSNEAWQIIKKDIPENSEPKNNVRSDLFTIVRLIPAIPGDYPNSVYNEITGEQVPVQFNEITTAVNKQFSKGELILILLCLIGSLTAMIWALVCFIRLIRNINRSHIFVWSNVSFLKQLGIAFIFVFFINLLFGYFNYSSILEQVSIAGYKIDWTSSIQTTNLIIGLAGLLVAEIFAMGLRLQEEQDLTI